MCTARTGLEGPGLTVAQKIWYCVASVGGQYIWARLQSFSAFRRWGDSEQVLFFLGFFCCISNQLKGKEMWWRWLEVGTNVVCISSEAIGTSSMDFDTTHRRILQSCIILQSSYISLHWKVCKWSSKNVHTRFFLEFVLLKGLPVRN